MLILQRASAGSGKTFTLAKKYIWYLITTPDGGRRRLRTDREIADSARHILAVTFTNKATQEMKSRIVERLADLAGRVTSLKDTPYLADFINDLGDASEDMVRSVCRTALRCLLDRYSDFHVSTIDSFFQSILRTFTYETELNDNYQVEIDSKLAAKVGVDATLSSVNRPAREGTNDVRFWLRLIMERSQDAGNKWNIFHKSDFNSSLYGQLKSYAELMEREDFKKISPELDAYFEGNPDALRKAFTSLDSRYSQITTPLRAAIRKSAAEALAFIEANFEAAQSISYLKDHLNRLKKASDGSLSAAQAESAIKQAGKNSYMKKSSKNGCPPDMADKFNSLLGAFYSPFAEERDRLAEEGLSEWPEMAKSIAFIGLLSAIRANSNEFFTSNNVICLSDTNQMLDRIIGDDDTPFIYERIGTRLEDFLIDEFQDTSAMQWRNFRPLIEEADSRGGENLIIGDAKQSIYRFRNADPSLILRTVPRQFPAHEAHGEIPAENTNYRSYLRIVQFNNTLFRELAAIIDADNPAPEGTSRDITLAGVYSNVVQQIKERELEGYVHTEFFSKDLFTILSDEGNRNENAYPQAFGRIPEIINEIRGRGYRNLKDIAILVRTNKTGKCVVNALMDYNGRCRELGLQPIEFVSDESLGIARSEAVKVIIATLRMIESGYITSKSVQGSENPESANEPQPLPYISLRNISCRFNYFAARHPELPGTELIRRFMNEPESIESSISALISSLFTVALPSLVEAIIINFISEDVRRREAPFIAAFQDLVAEHSERYSSDAATFLRWWDDTASEYSISSPEDMNAVRIMTVHKSKGLESDFIIIPENLFTGPRMASEYVWLKPELPPADAPWPPYMPFKLSSIRDSHPIVYDNIFSAALMDDLNNAYVGLTRAKKELYILADITDNDAKGGKPKTFNAFLHKMLPLLATHEPGSENELPFGAVRAANPEYGGCCAFAAGKRLTFAEEKEILDRREKGDTPKPKKPIVITGNDYAAHGSFGSLIYKEEPLKNAIDDEDPDPRSEGNLMHKIMEDITTSADIDKAIRRLVISGEVSEERASDFRERLHIALRNPEIASWFAPGNRVLSERSILNAGKSIERPDRVIVRPDGTAVVIDYKFGARHLPRYTKKVASYCRLLREAGLAREVEGRLWYVLDRTVAPYGSIESVNI